MYTDLEFSNLIKQVEDSFQSYLAKSEDKEKEENKEKAEDKSEPKEKAQEAEHEAHEADEKAHAAEEKAHEAGHEAEESESKAKEEEHESEPKAAEAEGHDYDDEDMEHMEKLYRSMSKAELKAHHGCASKVLGEHGEEMEKSEKVVSVEIPAPVDAEEIKLLKSEAEGYKAKAEELKKTLDLATEFLSKLVKKSAPKGKAITSLETIAKSEVTIDFSALPRNEVIARLSERAKSETLSKSDRDAINAFCVKKIGIEGISHLLK